MRFTRAFLPLTFSLTLIASPVFADAGRAHGGMHLSRMAEVMEHLNHYPSDAEKKELNKIIGDSTATEAEKTIATAIMNMQHSASDADKAKLDKIANDASQPANIRELALIVKNISHKPSGDDIKKLHSMR